jgi:hypothetical protein
VGVSSVADLTVSDGLPAEMPPGGPTSRSALELATTTEAVLHRYLYHDL